MGYPGRFFAEGFVWHLTGRCHNRDFLFGQSQYRQLFVDTLFENQVRYSVPVLNFMVTSNHIHLLVMCPHDSQAIPLMMRDVGSKVAAFYNKRTGRKGGFWERRYHATAVETDEHLVRCSLYIDLNMVRAGAVGHPLEWKHCGCHELLKRKQRYRVVDTQVWANCANLDEDDIFATYAGWLENALGKGTLSRDDIWTRELAVGSGSFVNHVRRQCGYSPSPQTRAASAAENVAPYGVMEDTTGNLLEWGFDEF